jgi:transcription initiation factor IIF auxiliary subunit
MEFTFNNYSRPVGTVSDHKWYEWKIFMDEPEETLKQVKSVEYRLHRSFPNPIRVIEDRASKFALKSSGWGEFSMIIIVYLVDGTEKQTQYFLDLSKSWPPGEN